jgi:hypothetical protein
MGCTFNDIGHLLAGGTPASIGPRGQFANSNISSTTRSAHDFYVISLSCVGSLSNTSFSSKNGAARRVVG